MLDIRIPSKQTVLDQLADAFRTSLDPHHASSLIEFSRQFYRVSAPEELSASSIDHLYATVLSYWKTIQAFDATEAKVEVFNPNVEQHGWHSGHTVIRVHVLDMPFLVDSVRVELNRQELAIHSISNCVIKVRRDQDGQLLELKATAAGEERMQAESVIHLEVDRHTDPDSLRVIREALVEVLAEVRMAVDDHIEMREQLGLIQQELRQGAAQGDKEQREEINRFLDWLLDDHFIFLGYQPGSLTASGRRRSSCSGPEIASESCGARAPLVASKKANGLTMRYSPR
ncbi:NAD-glutamate dehydrogenase domain-containing protein [Oceanisphaera psychrotolerans]|uniref:NAD-glutamate dehydrogenase domain-containing protein n=1 Tax=Oceanisphaera psychrotolerans TaxID=1414654 RepID=UPI000A4C0DB7|nr:NAD-glutamate dehydrogenase domain-containing protein [Oceanisphaera psychrotolerans]